MKLRETRNHPRLTIFLCFLLLVAMVAIIFAIVDYLRDEQPVAEQPSAQPGPIIAQETAGAEVDRAVSTLNGLIRGAGFRTVPIPVGLSAAHRRSGPCSPRQNVAILRRGMTPYKDFSGLRW